MFERFTRRARLAIADAHAQAASLGHDFIGTEHQLLGLLAIGEGVAHAVLTEAGVTYDGVRERVNELIGTGGVDGAALATIGIDLDAVRDAVEDSFGRGALDRAMSPSGRGCGAPSFTPRAKKVMELSLREALAMGHDYIGTEHMLLAIVREGDGVAAHVLDELAPDTDFRTAVVNLLRRGA